MRSNNSSSAPTAGTSDLAAVQEGGGTAISAPISKLPPLREDNFGVIPHSGGNLRDIETTLLALIEVDPEELSPELRAEYERDLQEAIRKAPEKRERVAMKLFDLGQRAAVKRAASEAHRQKAQDLEESADRFERDAARLKNYVLDVMRELPKPKKGCRTLEGTSATFKAKGVADSLVIDDETVLPEEFKTVTVTFRLEQWRGLVDFVESQEDYGFAYIKTDFGRVPASDIKAALQKAVRCAVCGGTGDKLTRMEGDRDTLVEQCVICEGSGEVSATVPGAHLLTDKLRLEVS